MTTNKQLTRTISLVTCQDNAMQELISVCLHMAHSNTGSITYCALMLRDENHNKTGYGTYDGNDYTAEAMAFKDALKDAEIKPITEIYHFGIDGIKDELKAIANFLGYENTIVICHG